MRIRSAFCSLIAACAIVVGAVDAPVVFAQDEADEESSFWDPNEGEFTRHGPYAGLGFKWQVPGFQGRFRDQNYGNSWGFDARGGYRFFDWFAAEAIVEYADEFGPRAPGTTAKSLSFVETTVNAKFIVPIERFQPYLTTGVGFLYANDGSGFINSVEDRDFGFAGRIGAGIDFYLTPHVSVFVDNGWTMTTDNTEDLYYYSLGGGARYSF